MTRTVTTTRTVTQAATEPCGGNQLSGTFNMVEGSQAAGQVAYLLTLTNASQTMCTISGPPHAVLLASGGKPLPTDVVFATGVAGTVLLAPGVGAMEQARFSPDVPGAGDAESGPCQPKAYTLQVTPVGAGTVDVPIKPPTSVCERGTLDFGALYGGG